MRKIRLALPVLALPLAALTVACTSATVVSR